MSSIRRDVLVVLLGAVAMGCGDAEGTSSTDDGVTTATAAGATSTVTSTSISTGAVGSTSTSGAASGQTPGVECDDPALVWQTGAKTNYESYPAPDSKECVEFNGCEYLGEFAACENTMPESWVAQHRIAAVFPLGNLALHRICVRAGAETIVVTVIDTCADSDCSGCCTENRGSADALIDLEKYTNDAFGVEDGPVEWADLGPGDPAFDGCN